MNYDYIYLTLLQAFNINTNSWFDIKRYKNDTYNKKKKNKQLIIDIFIIVSYNDCLLFVSSILDILQNNF